MSATTRWRSLDRFGLEIIDQEGYGIDRVEMDRVQVFIVNYDSEFLLQERQQLLEPE